MESVATSLLGVTNDVFEAAGLHYVTLWIGCRVTGRADPAVCDSEVDAAHWCAVDDLPAPLFAPFGRLLESIPLRAALTRAQA